MVSNSLLALSSLFWGLNNQGDAQRISIDHYTSGYVLGVKGEDIRPAAPVSNPIKIKVAVLDTGADSTHPELKKVLLKGYNFVDKNEDTNDTHGHGTHLSGIIALQATQNASIIPVKVVQTGPNAPIRPQDVQAGSGTALTENVAKGLVYAIEQGAKVINLSLAWPVSIRSKKVDEAMALAAQKEVIIVSSAGNDGTQANVYPCIYTNVICVGAHGPDGSFTYFSNYGSMVDVLAPGITILSTWPMNKSPNTFVGQVGYEFRNGTSMAAPYVAGAAAELLSRGFSATETRARLLLGTRATAKTTQYTSRVVGDFSIDHNRESKFSRFGNLDISHSLNVTPQSLIVPARKAAQEISWNGVDSSATINVHWKNIWKGTQSTRITVGDQVFNLGAVDAGMEINTPVVVSLSENTEALFNLPVKIESIESTGASTAHDSFLTFSVARKISLATIPENANVYQFVGLNPRAFPSVRTVVNADQSLDRGFAFIKNDEVVLTRKGFELGRTKIASLPQEKFWNIYRLDENRYAMITSRVDKGDPRESFYIRHFDSRMNLISEAKVPTTFTVMPENFQWRKIGLDYVPFWLSIGVTPTIDQPPYDPWNKNPIDPKIPRMYFFDGKEVRTVKLADDEFPLALLPTGEVLVSKGSGYYIQYSMIKIDLAQKEKILSRNEITLPTYRMLLSLDSSNKVWDLKGSTPRALLISGPSTPGNLRTTQISASGVSSKDQILKREGTLDSLISVLGAYQDLDQQYFFVQTHYDFKFYRSNSSETHSISLNRYSYIPSMIFSRNFYPFVAKDRSGNGSPAVYMAAGVSNSNTSEVVIGNPKTGAISKPAKLRFETGDECLSIANLIPATETEPAKQVFICDTSVISVPLVK